MALPEAIPVRYSEEEAGYVTFRPVVRQTFRLNELLDMVVSVTGKDAARIRQILRSGNVVFHYYHYWWEGFEAGPAELDALLARFPDPNPARAFSAPACTMAILESGNAPVHTPVELPRAVMSRKRLFRRQSFWDAMLALAAVGPLAYHGYSYVHRADEYRLALTGESQARLIVAAASLAPRNLRQTLRTLGQTVRIVFVCPRGGT